ncbi:1-acyl-sn-glycerol-3-phosphate acyltransferase [Candidatus Giovannonibacteria bacterium]|nr:1-acyl-sn-glycerol-3-phosphate acyltransferase [Candidatus Giovannonibacteria bacterium]
MKYFYRFVQQFIFWPIFWLFLKIFFDVEIVGRENLKKIETPLLIVSNHKTLLDGFVIGLALPWGSRIFPIRFMIEDIRFKARTLEILRKLQLMRIFRWLAGGFPSKRGQGVSEAIKIPLKILNKRGTILMFPEGKMVREDELGEFFHGASVLADASKAKILPVHLKFGGGKVRISFGKLFSLAAKNTDHGTQILKEKILELSR